MPALELNPHDHVAVATSDLAPGELLQVSSGRRVTLRGLVARGHKVALVDIEPGGTVTKYGQVIGVASARIAAGEHVHTHNLEFSDGDRAYEFGTARVAAPAWTGPRPTFAGYRRANGRAATRNYIGIVTSVNCSAATARMIADEFRPRDLAGFENVHGVIALTHGSGCGLVSDSEGANLLLRTLRGYAQHPNLAGIVFLGLGCEMLQLDLLQQDLDLSPDVLVEKLIIQATGGVRATVAAGVRAVEAMLPQVDRLRREPIDAGELVLGLNCGGSDGYSGITANPALGVASDLLVGLGGASVLAETPEIYGAEHLLTSRAVSESVGRTLLERIDWWRGYTAAGGGTVDNNPSPGNKAGGLTTILEKSLGAVAKAGQSELSHVLRYADAIPRPGLSFMDTPGYDPVSVTGLVAGGAHVIVFTTGRGSVLGTKPAPCIKVATNSELARQMPDDIDLNAGVIVDGTATLDEVGRQIFDLLLEVASGRETASESLGIGADEFVPWQLGAVT
ncbi:altronate dehydratase [Micrococcales bacterium 31B]|nr:altronate dehydratase [Micrococcales bacterium 31B]